MSDWITFHAADDGAYYVISDTGRAAVAAEDERRARHGQASEAVYTDVRLRIEAQQWYAFEDRCQRHGQDPHYVLARLINAYGN
ncbi:hypothetical protein [Streptomyces sp. N35]|uniref:hypothetical protein n=1 Tax=Streptomyces sp. N35 TaxID=2795730 RepID=UPI0018F6202D|nr:hypothetical protein [Streptomyces sp. N35]